MKHTFITGTVLKSDAYEKTNTTVITHNYEDKKVLCNGLSFSSYSTYESVNVNTERFKEVFLLVESDNPENKAQTQTVTLPGDFPLLEGHSISLAYDDGNLLYVFNHNMKKKSYIGPSRLKTFYGISDQDEAEYNSIKLGASIKNFFIMLLSMLLVFGWGIFINSVIGGILGGISGFLLSSMSLLEPRSGIYVIAFVFGFLALRSDTIVLKHRNKFIDVSMFPTSVQHKLVRDVHDPYCKTVIKSFRITFATLSLLTINICFDVFNWLLGVTDFITSGLDSLGLISSNSGYTQLIIHGFLLIAFVSVIITIVVASLQFAKKMAAASLFKLANEHASGFRSEFDSHLMLFEPK